MSLSQIKLSVYREIKQCNASSSAGGKPGSTRKMSNANLNNYSGFVVADTSGIESCMTPARPKPQNPSEEINIGALASDYRHGHVRRIRTYTGEEVVVISPKPKYGLAGRCGLGRKGHGNKKQVTVDGRVCFTCHRTFRNSKCLVTHILKTHSR